MNYFMYASLHVVVLQRTAKKSTKIQNAHAEPLLCSLNLLFGDILVGDVIVVCLNYLLVQGDSSEIKVTDEFFLNFP